MCLFVSELFAVDPKAQGGIGDEIDLLAVGQGIVAVGELLRVIAL